MAGALRVCLWLVAGGAVNAVQAIAIVSSTDATESAEDQHMQRLNALITATFRASLKQAVAALQEEIRASRGSHGHHGPAAGAGAGPQ